MNNAKIKKLNIGSYDTKILDLQCKVLHKYKHCISVVNIINDKYLGY